MKVEINRTSMKLGASYKDDRCKEIEDILRTDQSYMGWVVNRQNLNRVDDPFFFRDSQGKLMMVLMEWEIDTLDEIELLSIIKVHIERHSPFSSREVISFLLIGVLMIPLLVLLSNPLIPTVFESLSSVLVPGILSLVIAIFILIIILLHQKRIRNSKQREVDIRFAFEDFSFLSAIRKLATAPDGIYVNRRGYEKRLKAIEAALHGENY